MLQQNPWLLADTSDFEVPPLDFINRLRYRADRVFFCFSDLLSKQKTFSKHQEAKILWFVARSNYRWGVNREFSIYPKEVVLSRLNVLAALMKNQFKNFPDSNTFDKWIMCKRRSKDKNGLSNKTIASITRLTKKERLKYEIMLPNERLKVILEKRKLSRKIERKHKDELKSKLYQDRLSRINKLISNGSNFKQISEELGLSRMSIHRILKGTQTNVDVLDS